jgi:hypothetical protein
MSRRATGLAELQQARALDGRLLRDQAHADPALDDPLALVGRGRRGEDTQQRRLARAVATYEAGPLPRFQSDVRPVEQPAGAVGEPYVTKGEKGGGHAAV